MNVDHLNDTVYFRKHLHYVRNLTSDLLSLEDDSTFLKVEVSLHLVHFELELGALLLQCELHLPIFAHQLLAFHSCLVLEFQQLLRMPLFRLLPVSLVSLNCSPKINSYTKVLL